MTKTKWFVGKKINHLTLVEYISGDASVFQCDCGTVKKIRPSRVATGVTKTCSCLGGKKAPSKTVLAMGPTNKRSAEYNIWKSMHQRCENKNSPSYKRYGGRGIKVCDRWTGSSGFANFYADMGKKPQGMSIDRVDNDRGYEPSNCKWATYSQQANNTSKTLFFDYKGRKVTVTELANILSIPRWKFHYLLRKDGYDKILLNYDQSSGL